MSRRRSSSRQTPPGPTPSRHRRRLRKGQALYARGEASKEFYRLVSGEIHLVLPARRKDAGPVVLGPGAIFGQAGFFAGHLRLDSAICATDVVVDTLRRDDVLMFLESHNRPARKLLSRFFDVAGEPGTPNCGEDVVDGVPLVRLLLRPASRALAAWIGHDPIEITRLPFIVGRARHDADDDVEDQIDLALDDEKPFQLSRQHFVIDTFDGELVVRDSASYHGTTVNDQRIGRAEGVNMAPLRIGENSIVAGSGESPYCFTLSIDTS